MSRLELDRSELRGFEQIAVPVCDYINHQPRLKEVAHAILGRVNAAWITRYTGRVWRVDGFEEHIRDLDAPSGVIVASNHRSFFDLYVCMAWMLNNTPHLVRRVHCPVRSDFFYTKPIGLFINLAMSSGAMWPPVFRDDRRSFNLLGLEQLASKMHRGTFVGIHPEGRRSKDDPRTLLPAKPGLGLLLQQCPPDVLVLPYFTLGLENNLAKLIQRNLRPPGQRGTTVSMRYGTPLKAGDIIAEHPDAQDATDFVMSHIDGLAQADKAMRESHSDVELQNAINL